MTFFRDLLYYRHLSKGGVVIKIKISSITSVLLVLIVVTLSGCTQGNESFTIELTLCEGDAFYIGGSNLFRNALTFHGVTTDKSGNQKAILRITEGGTIKKQREVGIGNNIEVVVTDGSKVWKKEITVKEIKRVKIDGEEKFAVRIRIKPIT